VTTLIERMSPLAHIHDFVHPEINQNVIFAAFFDLANGRRCDGCTTNIVGVSIKCLLLS
jgi:hypothetical protein